MIPRSIRRNTSNRDYAKLTRMFQQWVKTDSGIITPEEARRTRRPDPGNPDPSQTGSCAPQLPGGDRWQFGV